MSEAADQIFATLRQSSAARRYLQLRKASRTRSIAACRAGATLPSSVIHATKADISRVTVRVAVQDLGSAAASRPAPWLRHFRGAAHGTRRAIAVAADSFTEDIERRGIFDVRSAWLDRGLMRRLRMR
jgi:GntR family transcriptional regulator